MDCCARVVRLATLRFATAVAAAASPAIARGQPAPTPLSVQHSRATGLASFITAADNGPIAVFPPAGRAQAEPIDFLAQYGHLFGIADPAGQLALDRQWADPLQHTHTSFSQVHRGVPVYSGIVKVHQNLAGEFIAANGDFYLLPETLKTAPALAAAEAARIALAAMPQGRPRVESTALVIVDPGWYGDPPKGAHLAYHVIVSDLSTAAREAFFIDAQRGDILDRWSLVHTAKQRSVHDASLITSNCCVAHPDIGCEDLVCSNFVCSFDPFCCADQWDEICVSIAAFLCGDLCVPGPLARGEGDPPNGDADVDSAYDYYGDTYEYFSRGLGRDSWDDLGATIVGTVNVTSQLECPNAAWLTPFQQTFFCTGTASDDIVAHEYSHAVTEATANLIYQNQSGQLNESFSDVFGELIDLFNGNVAFVGAPAGPPLWPDPPADAGTDTPNNLRTACSFSPTHANGIRWLMGEDAVGFGGAIRDMWAPTCFGDPDRVGSPFLPCNPFFDNGGVHFGSGIPNHAFAMLTDGKTFNAETVVGIGPIKAGAVWYRALTVYLTVSSDFRDAVHAFTQAARDLVGASLPDPRTGLRGGIVFTDSDMTEVARALRATEMEQNTVCGANVLSDAPPVPCPSITVIHANDFETQVDGWGVANTAPPPNDYDWGWLQGNLPFGRPGKALFCEDRNVGDCEAATGAPGDESGVHFLISPEISLPSPVSQPTLSFVHYMGSDPGWDGGNVHLSINGGAFELIPAEAFSYNPYNTLLLPDPPNNNPMATEPAWSGFGGQWGTSLVDLSRFVSGGETIRFRFDFGKDRCIGIDGWYLDDFQVFDADSPRIEDSDPDDGDVDAAKANDLDDADSVHGWQSVVLTFDRSPTGIGPEQFVVPQRRAGGIMEPGPRVLSASPLSGNRLSLTFDRPISPGAWTKITHYPSGSSTCLGFLPTDASQDGRSSEADLAALIACLDAGPGNCPLHRCDLDREGACTSADLTTAVDHLYGAGAYAAWHGTDIGPSPCGPQ